MENVRESIISANKQFMAAFSRGDAEAIAGCYTEDATILPPGAPLMTGRSAIQSFWQSVLDMGIKEAKLETLDVESRGDTAYEIGRFTLTISTDGNSPQTVTGKYVVIWKNHEGSWRLHTDIWNSDAQ